MQYFVHNGYMGWSYGTPSDPQLISSDDAAELIKRAGLSLADIAADLPPVQFAEKGEYLYHLLGNNRFLQYGDIEACGDKRPQKIYHPLEIDWNEK